MSKDVKEVVQKEVVKSAAKELVQEKVEVKSVINAQEKQALDILIKAVKIAQNKGAFELDDAVVIGNAKNVLQRLIN